MRPSQVVPPGLASGDSKLSAPSIRSVKSEVREVDGFQYTFIAFTSETTTRSGYDVRRKHVAVAAEVRGHSWLRETSGHRCHACDGRVVWMTTG